MWNDFSSSDRDRLMSQRVKRLYELFPFLRLAFLNWYWQRGRLEIRFAAPISPEALIALREEIPIITGARELYIAVPA